MTPIQDAEWRLKRARSLIERAKMACSEGEIYRACDLAVAAIAEIPLPLLKTRFANLRGRQ